MNTNSKAVRKYLSLYTSLADNAIENLQTFFKKRHYQQAVVIPAFNESINFIHRFAAIPSRTKSLLIVVANCPSYCEVQARHNTNTLIEQVNKNLANENVMKGVTFGQLNSLQDILLLDITDSRPSLTKDSKVESGVGFARKIGMDIAVDLWSQHIVESPWVFNSDADAFWPAGYLDFRNNQFRNKGGIVLSFNHQHAEHNPLLTDAAALYDVSLRYYVLGLRWAKSPWAYHTIGSTLMIHGESYAETRGFPIREAGEDFYLLNKIAKNGTIYCPTEPHISLSDRSSNRVPFGTGPAVSRIEQQQDIDQSFQLYDPAIFGLLHEWHQVMPSLFKQSSHADYAQSSEPLWRGLIALGLEKALKHAKQQCKNQAQFDRHILQWFDGFRTLKLIHWLRDNAFASINYFDWKLMLQQDQIPFISSSIMDGITAEKVSVVSLSEQLLKLEQATLPYAGGLH